MPTDQSRLPPDALERADAAVNLSRYAELALAIALLALPLVMGVPS